MCACPHVHTLESVGQPKVVTVVLKAQSTVANSGCHHIHFDKPWRWYQSHGGGPDSLSLCPESLQPALPWFASPACLLLFLGSLALVLVVVPIMNGLQPRLRTASALQMMLVQSHEAQRPW